MENQQANNSSLSTILDVAAVVGAIGGSVASVVTQQVAFAAIPLSASIVLNVVNRRQMMTQTIATQQATQNAIGHFEQLSQQQISTLQIAYPNGANISRSIFLNSIGKFKVSKPALRHYQKDWGAYPNKWQTFRNRRLTGPKKRNSYKKTLNLYRAITKKWKLSGCKYAKCKKFLKKW
ncbi:hypothetical protein HC931_11635 [Candidatus Gracilibacteria bacterium]|nr:hypothetical protein [Candidatus Gracilibacteria bacterium]